MCEVVIQVDAERDAYAVTKLEDLIHQKELEQLKGMLQSTLALAKEYAETKKESVTIPTRRHDTIMLAGVRGSGKTTFMLSMLQWIRKSENGFAFADAIETLEILDPTLIEDKVHIFVNIVSMIRDRVEEKAKTTNCLKGDGADSRDYREWQDSFRRLAEGLPSINGVGPDGFSGDTWLDSEFVMDQGVRRAHAANMLERNFHSYVKKSLNFINKKAFILCFDDIDTHFGKGGPVLEVIHKYLTTPQLITIMSGDPSLYSLLIRDNIWKNFSNRLLDMEARSAEEREEFKETVVHLEEQYFLKLLKPERRLFLNTLYHKEQQQDYKVFVAYDAENKIPLKNAYRRILSDLGIIGIRQRNMFYEFLASLPVRTQKQILYSFRDSNAIDTSIVDIFWSDLSEKGTQVSNLRNSPRFIVRYIVDYLVKNDIVTEGYTLNPVFADPMLNCTQFALGALFANQTGKDAAQIFEYWVRVALTKEVGALLGGRRQGSVDSPSIENFIKYCEIKQARSSRYVARFATAYLRSIRAYELRAPKPDGRVKKTDTSLYDNKSWHGTLPLYALGKRGHGTPGRIDSVLEDPKVPLFLKIVGYLPLSGATDHKGHTLPIYSFYNVLGVLGEILNVVKGGNEQENESLNVAAIAGVLVKDAQFREYPIPQWATAGEEVASGQSPEDGGRDIDRDVERDDLNNIFVKAIADWAMGFPNIHVTASTLGKIFTRFFYAMNTMDKDLGNENRLGEWMHRMVVAFFHSVVVVEALDTLDVATMSLRLNNPISSDDLFVENMKILNNSESRTGLHFSKWILSCPLLRLYLKNGIPEMDKFIAHEGDFDLFTTGGVKVNYKIGTLAGYLNRVSIRGHEKKVVLNRFSVRDSTAMEDFKAVCLHLQLGSTAVSQMSDSDLSVLMKKYLENKYENDSINKGTAKSIKTRIANGLKW